MDEIQGLLLYVCRLVTFCRPEPNNIFVLFCGDTYAILTSGKNYTTKSTDY
jgi:hypothetical protein